MDSIRNSLAQHGLIRPSGSRVLGGVCAGLGRRYGFTPWTARLLFVLILMVIPGSQILIYPLLWILMPSQDQGSYAAPRPPEPGSPEAMR
jgi:phage shock protein C